MNRHLKYLALVLAGCFLLVGFTSTAQAATVKGANTRLEADKGSRGVWYLWLCTRLEVNEPQAVSLRSRSKVGMKVISLLKYEVTEKTSRTPFWPGKPARCYAYTLDTKPLSRVQARQIRAFFTSTKKPVIGVTIGRHSGEVRLNG